MEKWLSFLQCNFYYLDRSTQELIYQSFRDLIYKDIYILFQNHELADDVVQEAFIKVITKASTLQHPVNLKAWIKKVSRNTAYDMFKKDKKYRYFPDPNIVKYQYRNGFPPSYELNVAELVEQQLRDGLLHDSLNDLKTKYHYILLLYYLEDKSHKEIAHQLNISEQASAQLLVRARKKLLQNFSKKWVEDDV
ncbi:RNA polymerase sigma factor [Paenibacillus sp. FJAT-26967]|uniref:RNA polymerase sigma factor n=1 Tax=Paenibacillus sp. FJAT-26967 TaxID=1729690 RepID=UPI000837C677|nr:sigma-70 family RNA polymerase sigma factor [Paenibacillus sp. FJAT-26967]